MKLLSLNSGPPWSANITCVDPEVRRGSLRMRLQWSAPQLANGQSPIAYRVTYLGMSPGGDTTNNVVSVDTKKTTNTSVTLRLSVNALYEITVSCHLSYICPIYFPETVFSFFFTFTLKRNWHAILSVPFPDIVIISSKFTD